MEFFVQIQIGIQSLCLLEKGYKLCIRTNGEKRMMPSVEDELKHAEMKILSFEKNGWETIVGIANEIVLRSVVMVVSKLTKQR